MNAHLVVRAAVAEYWDIQITKCRPMVVNSR